MKNYKNFSVRIASALLMILILTSTAFAAGRKVNSFTWDTLTGGDEISATDSQRVFDYAGIFTDSQKSSLESTISSFRKEYSMDFVILTTSAPHSYYGVEIADDFYDYNGFGAGTRYSGIIYYIDMYNREPVISTCGDMISYINDARLDALFERSWSSLSQGQYAQASETVISNIKQFLNEGIIGDNGDYYYDISSDTVLPRGAFSSGEIITAFILPIPLVLIAFLIIKRRYTVSGSKYEYELSTNSNLVITSRIDRFIRRTTSRVRKSSPPSGGHRGGRSVRVGSSGRSHGGRAGRRF